jgi:hypothetical protein
MRLTLPQTPALPLRPLAPVRLQPAWSPQE